MAPAEVKREGDDYDIPNEADDIHLMNESRAEPDHGCEAGPSNEEATNMNVEDGGADVKKEMVDDAHRNDIVGQRLPKYLDRVAEKSTAPKALTRVGCKAQFHIRYDADAGEGGKYVVTHFVADHNHELEEQHCVMYLRSHRSLNSADKAQAMAMRNVGVKTSQIMDYMENQSGSYENVGFIRTDLHNHIQAERRVEVEDSDAQGALVYLCAKLDVDAPNETIETYTWVLETFMEAMGNKAPVSVLTDGDKSMREAIRRVFPDARHRLCNWHLGKNAVSNVHISGFAHAFKQCMDMNWHLGKNAISNVHISGFAHAFKQCMDMETDKTKFERGWTTMVEKFGLQTNSWVLETYEKRHMWAEAYMRRHFFAGMKSTQRSECMNAYFNPFLQHKLKLYEFVRHYDRALARIRYNEAGDDAETNNNFPVRFSRTVGTNSDADTPHITDREYNAESLPVCCKIGLVDPSTPHIKQRRLFFDVSPNSKQPVGQYGSVEAAVWKNDSNTIDEVNQVDSTSY
ncbi:protein FAR1-RELATED SEQUENCE 5-like [Camellia sinensis]|uniref:protein FAR1-RELATED SEQUENCE 5-like n=1 Tax=Camellia sinensis TaxID=4442 RepID=UPI00103694BE|nr:protein FAR1-RELATED SEQUENCE 5-like [Camellia sinensis]